MKTLVNHKERAQELKAQAEQLQDVTLKRNTMATTFQTPQEIIKGMLGKYSTDEIIATINEAIPHEGTRHQDERSEINNLRSTLFLFAYLYEAGIPENYNYDDLDQRRGYLKCMRKAMTMA